MSCGRVTSSRTRENFERDQVADLRDVDSQTWKRFDQFGGSHHLRFDPRRREQQVDDRSLRPRRQREPHRRQPANGFLFDDRFDLVPGRAKVVDERFRLIISFERDRQIGVTRESGLGSNRNGEPSNQRKRRVMSLQICADVAERGLEGGHVDLWRGSTTRPGQSPDSAPGRSRSHRVSRDSISSPVA